MEKAEAKRQRRFDRKSGTDEAEPEAGPYESADPLDQLEPLDRPDQPDAPQEPAGDGPAEQAREAE